MESEYYHPAGEGRAELKIKNSRFLGFALPCGSPEEAKTLLSEIRREHPGATHVVHAFVLGQKGALLGQSDDGEPKGTAGKPVLEVLKGRKITNILLAVVRYFGGTKLGTGGLVKAYGETAKETLEKLPLEAEIPRETFHLTCPYSLHGVVRRLLEGHSCAMLKETFEEEVFIEFRLAVKDFDELEKALSSLSSGEISLKRSI